MPREVSKAQGKADTQEDSKEKEDLSIAILSAATWLPEIYASIMVDRIIMVLPMLH